MISGYSQFDGRRWEPPTLEDLQPHLPGYRLEELIGRGGMGAVYRAVQLSLDRPVALKVMPHELLSDATDDFARRFRNEAKTMARLSHPNIVAAYDYGETQHGLLFLAMEFIAGTDLAEHIREKGRLNKAETLKHLRAICAGLAYAHANGVVHRDVKPANVLLNEHGVVKVADFGLARRHSPGDLSQSKVHSSVGTIDFIAPEVFVAEDEIDHRADLYAVGVTLYQMLTGAVPRGLWKMPSQLVGSDPQFDAIIDKAMQAERGRRYQSVSEMLVDLAKLEANDSPEPKVTQKPKQQAWKRMAAIAGIALLPAAGLYTWKQQDQSAQQVPSIIQGFSNFLPDAKWTSQMDSKDAWTYFWQRDDQKWVSASYTGASFTPKIGNGGIRVRLRWDTLEQAENFLIRICQRSRRASENYAAVPFPPTGGYPGIVAYGDDDSGRLLVNTGAAMTFVPGEHTVEFYVKDGLLALFYDGQEIVTAKDTSLTQGYPAISVGKGTVILSVETTGIGGLPPVALPAAGPAKFSDHRPDAVWNRRTMADASRAKGWKTDSERWIAEKGTPSAIFPTKSRDMGIRIRFSASKQSFFDLAVRRESPTDWSTTGYISGLSFGPNAPSSRDKPRVEMIQMKPTVVCIVLNMADETLTLPLHSEHTAEFYAEGQKLTFYLNGDQKITTDDATLTEGYPGFICIPTLEVHSVETCDLDAK